MRIRRIVIAVLGIVIVSYVISSYKAVEKKKTDFPKIVYGFPTYPGSRFSPLMSGLNGDPYLAVFLSNDSHEKVVQFYKEKLKRDCKVLRYGRKKLITMEIYQFQVELGAVVTDYISRGVEVIPLNLRNQRVYDAKTKIKIIVPRKEVLETRLRQNRGRSTTDSVTQEKK